MLRSCSVPLLLALAAGCGSPDAAKSAASPAAPQAVPVRVEALVAASFADTVEAIGTVEAAETVEVRPEAAGTVVEIGFTEGAPVEKGQLLVRLRDDDARASLAEATAKLDLAQAQLARAEALRAQDNVSQAELDRATADRDLAAAQVARAKETLRRTAIRAPFAGVAGRRTVAPGEVVDPSRPVTRVEQLATVTIDVTLPERELPRLAPGLQAEVEVDARPGETFTGTLAFLAPRVREGTRTVEGRIRVENPDGKLLPGMTARARLVVARTSDALLVPAQAVVQGADGASVWVVDAEGKAARRPVKLGERNADRVAVAEGLAAGDRVIVEGLVRLRPGAPVAVQGSEGSR